VSSEKAKARCAFVTCRHCRRANRRGPPCSLPNARTASLNAQAGWQAHYPQDLFATPQAKHTAGDHLDCNTLTNTVLTAPVGSVRVLTRTMVGKHMAQTPSTASSPGGTCSTPLVPAATTTPIGVTPATGKHFAWPKRLGRSPTQCLHAKPSRSWILQPSPFGPQRGDLVVWRHEEDMPPPLISVLPRGAVRRRRAFAPDQQVRLLRDKVLLQAFIMVCVRSELEEHGPKYARQTALNF